VNTHADFLVIGSGIAGLFTALQAAEFGSVQIATKATLSEGSTRYAQGGIAAVIEPDNDIDAHIADTIISGAGLCDEDAVRVMCTEGPERIRDLMEIGVEFDEADGALERGLEGAHSKPRVLHAGGDATGAFIEAALMAALENKHVGVLEHVSLADIVVESGRAKGARFVSSTGEASTVLASNIILATGGAGCVYSHTTNPAVATGDGVAAAFRAGAVVRDAEFFQFHPTALAAPGPAFLISEAVRGEGAVLRNEAGEAFMKDVHPLADLAPRDVVAREIARQMTNQDGKPVVLDTTEIDPGHLSYRFPGIHTQCRSRGIDWRTEPVPVTPAAHYWMGGVATDLYGKTSVPGLYAVGEVASTGVHGANRLASNSLLEGVVFARRVVEAATDAKASEPAQFDAQPLPLFAMPSTSMSASEVRSLMWDNVGLVRDEHGLRMAEKQLGAWTALSPAEVNLKTVCQLITAGALAREESRGAHYRSDFPDKEKVGTSNAWSAC
jgi:L-aspartate oxidase